MSKILSVRITPQIVATRVHLKVTRCRRQERSVQKLYSSAICPSIAQLTAAVQRKGQGSKDAGRACALEMLKCTTCEEARAAG